MNAHFTEAEFYNLLDNNDPQAKQHLAECEPCQAEIDSLRASLSNFRLAATNLSSLQTPPQVPSRLLGNSSHRNRFFTVPRAAWATGLVAAMALCTASVSLLHKPAAAPQPTVQTTSETAMAVAESQSDDALLMGIDNDLSTSVPPSLAPLDTNTAAEKTTTSSNN